MNDKEMIASILKDLGYAGATCAAGAGIWPNDLAQVRSRNMLWFRPDCSLHEARTGKIYP